MRYDLPIRVNHTPALPGGKPAIKDIREMVRDAQPRTLSIDTTAVEVLQHVCGASLGRAQVRALLPTIRERLQARPPQPPPGTGPFSQTDVFGAIFGLVHFMLHHGDDWVLATIPSSPNQKRPDIFAVPRRGHSWLVELKGVAPQSSQIRAGVRYDTCAHLKSQLEKAVLQVRYRGTPKELGPRVPFRTRLGPVTPHDHGGRAIASTILPDGWLGRRRDIPALTAEGCPPAMNCAAHCLRAKSPAYDSSLVGLLWYSAAASTGSAGRDAAWQRVLAASQALHAATWANAFSLADEALLALTERSSTLPFARSLILNALEMSRGLTTRNVRAEALAKVEMMGRFAREELEAEIDLGRPERPQTLAFESVGRADRRAHEEYQLRTDGYSGTATIVDGRLHLAPDLDMHDHAIEEGGGEVLAAGARSGLQSAIRRLGYDDFALPISELRPIEVRDGERSWRVASEASMSPFPPILPHRHHWSFDEARRRYEAGDRRAFVDWIHEWAHGTEMNRWPPAANLEDWLEGTSAWSSFDGRISIPLAG